MKFPNIPIPIIQAPTAAIAGPELAAAVSSAGGLGAMGLTWTSPEAAAKRVRPPEGKIARLHSLGEESGDTGSRSLSSISFGSNRSP